MVVVNQGDAVSVGAADVLRRLLLEQEPYRSRWQAHVQRTGRSQLHQSAIAQVLADHLRRTGELPPTQQGLPRPLKDAVARTLGGRLTQQQLEQFISAFEISRPHQDHLWRSFARDRTGVSRVRTAGSGPRRPVDAATYRSVSLEEFHVLGADGLPHTHRTVRVVRAVQPMDRYTYRFDASAVAIDVVRGGRPSDVYPTDREGLWALDIHLHDVLPPGQTAVLEHRTVFRYDTAPPTEFRRGVSGTVGSVTLRVAFHPAQLPANVWWGRWETLEEPPRLIVPWQVDEDGAVHWAGEQVHDQLVGFTWQW